MTIHPYSYRLLGAAMLMGSLVAVLEAQNPRPILEEILRAHQAGPVAPNSIEMRGRVERDGKTMPVRILATQDEALRIEYGDSGKEVLVVSEKLNFRDDGKAVAFSRTPSGFAALDITGPFLIQQLRNRPVRTEALEDGPAIGGGPTRRIRVQSDRSQTHKGAIRVWDSVDLYVTPAGVLAGVARSFYEGRPDRYTQAFTFLNYRETGGVLWPYRIELYLKGKLRQVFLIDEYRFNLPTDRDAFIPRRTR